MTGACLHEGPCRRAVPSVPASVLQPADLARKHPVILDRPRRGAAPGSIMALAQCSVMDPDRPAVAQDDAVVPRDVFRLWVAGSQRREARE